GLSAANPAKGVANPCGIPCKIAASLNRDDKEIIMPQYLCIGAPYFLGERIAARTEVEQIKASGIAAELGADWIDLQPDFTPDENPVATVNRSLAQTIVAHPQHVPL